MTSRRVLFILVLIFAVNAFAEPTIKVQSPVKVENSRKILLKNIAEISDLEENLATDLGNTEILTVSGNGQKLISGAQISKSLRKVIQKIEANIDQKIKLIVPDKVAIKVQLFNIDEMAVSEKVTQLYKQLCGICEIKISDVRLPLISKASDSAEWSVSLVMQQLPRGSFSLPLKVSDRGVERTFWVTGKIQIFKQVPVALHQLNLGERINEQDFEVKSRDVTMAIDNAVDATKAVGKLLGRGINANEVIWQNAIAKEIAVKPGQAVKVLSENEWMQISLNGVAQERGEIGDRVKILNPSTKSVITAVVEGPGIARALQ